MTRRKRQGAQKKMRIFTACLALMLVISGTVYPGVGFADLPTNPSTNPSTDSPTNPPTDTPGDVDQAQTAQTALPALPADQASEHDAASSRAADSADDKPPESLSLFAGDEIPPVLTVTIDPATASGTPGEYRNYVETTFTIVEENFADLPPDTELIEISSDDDFLEILYVEDFLLDEPGIYLCQRTYYADGNYTISASFTDAEGNAVVDTDSSAFTPVRFTLVSDGVSNGDALGMTYSQSKKVNELDASLSASRKPIVNTVMLHGSQGTDIPISVRHGSFDLPDGFLNAREITVSDYLGISTTLPYTLTAKQATENLFEDTSGNTYTLAFVVSVGSQSRELVLYRARLMLDAAGLSVEPLMFGVDINAVVNGDTYFNDHLLAWSYPTSVNPRELLNTGDSAYFPSNLSSLFTAEQSIVTFTGSNPAQTDPSAYPAHDALLYFTLNGASLVDPYNKNCVCVVDPQGHDMSIRFTVDASVATHEVLWNTEQGAQGTQALYDSESERTWVRSSDVLLVRDGYDFGNALSLDGSLIDPLPGNMTIVFTAVQDYFAKELATAYAIPLGRVCLDQTAPYLEYITFEEPLVSRQGILGYQSETTVTLSLSDIPKDTSYDPDAVSGFDSIQLFYQNEVYPLDFTIQRDESGNNLGTVEARFSLPLSDEAYYLSDFGLLLRDYAGNELANFALSAFYGSTTQDAVAGIVVDDTVPQLAVSYDNDSAQNGFYYNAPRTVLFTITEAHFGVLRTVDPSCSIIAFGANDQAVQNVTAERFTNPSGDGVTWLYALSFASDGDYVLNASFKDFVGFDSNSFSDHFVVDLTPPLIFVEFDNNTMHNSGYFDAPRTSTVRVMERNFSAALANVAASAKDAVGNAVTAPSMTGWASVATDEYRTTLYFGDELHYTLQAACTDLAGNEAQVFTEPEFIIDMTLPKISVEFLEDTQAFGDEVAPRVSFEDTNLEDYAATVDFTRIDGSNYYGFDYDQVVTSSTKVITYQDLEHSLENDNIYIMQATIVDRAGNTAEDTRIFSVNRFGSTYLLSDDTQAFMGSYIDGPHDVVVTEINVSGLQESETRVRLVHNDDVVTLTPDEDYSITEDSALTLWSEYTYIIPAEQFVGDGYYRALFRSMDRAGNLAENTMENRNSDRTQSVDIAFALDATAPLGVFINLEQGGIYHERGKSIELSFGDNLALDHALLLCDGEQVALFEASDSGISDVGTFDVPESNQMHNYSLVVYDKAGNITTVEANDVLITSDVVAIWLNTPLLFNGSIVAAITLVGVLVLAVWLIWRVRKNKRPIVFSGS
jgi:hypothetical protein